MEKRSSTRPDSTSRKRKREQGSTSTNKRRKTSSANLEKERQDHSPDHFQQRLDGLTKEAPPVADWKIKLLADETIRSIKFYPQDIAKALENFILTQRSHFARCGLYILDATLGSIFPTETLESPKTTVEEGSGPTLPTSGAKLDIRPFRRKIFQFLHALDKALPRIFYSFIKREKHRHLQLAPIEDEDIRLSSRDQVWIQRLLRQWYQRHYFKDATIMYIVKKLHLLTPCRNREVPRPWIAWDGSSCPDKKKKSKGASSSTKNEKTESSSRVQKKPSERLRILSLSDEALLWIFSFLEMNDLAVIPLVCQRFLRISQDEDLWKHVYLKPQRDTRVHKFIKSISLHWNIVRHLDFSNVVRMDDDILKTLAQNFGQLRTLRLAGCSQISDASRLTSIVDLNRAHLEVLDLSFLDITFNFDLVQAISRATKLRYLAIAECVSVTPQMIVHILSSCSQLTVLDARSCEALLCTFYRPDDQILSNSLQTLNLLQYHTFALKMRDIETRHLLTNFPSLQTAALPLPDDIDVMQFGHVEITNLDAWTTVRDNNLSALKQLLQNDPKQLEIRM